jgi:hypothetical protein
MKDNNSARLTTTTDTKSRDYAVDIAGALFGSKMVAADKKRVAIELDVPEESAENSEGYDRGPCRDRTYDQEIKSRARHSRPLRPPRVDSL